MKKYLLFVLLFMLDLFLLDYLVFYQGDVYAPHAGEIHYLSKAEDQKLWIDEGDGYKIFDLKGVDLGLGVPGHYASEKEISKEEYLRWFADIQNMGANVIRVYTLARSDLYDALYTYNQGRSQPLYLIHGVWVDEHMLNSYRSAFDPQFYEGFLDDCKDVIDAVHGRFKTGGADGQNYSRDISPWTYGYILGVEWDPRLVTFTDHTEPQRPDHEGEYFRTTDGSNFEIFLAEIGEQTAAYETEKYGTQRVIAFSNWATTDPFDYPENVARYFRKYAKIDVEHIHTTERFAPGQFASYHIYPYFPDYYSYIDPEEENTYLRYLTTLCEHHSMPVVISEFGVPSSRGMAAASSSPGRDLGGLNEREQGEALVSLYTDIKTAGCAGGIVFSWQDEWFKHTRNTMASVDLQRAPYWNDCQTAGQHFGLLSFDPGAEESICCVDGDPSEWTEEDLLGEEDGFRISGRYDEKYIYLLLEKAGWALGREPLYLPLDVTPKSGSAYIQNFALHTDREADFVLVLDGTHGSRLLVQERYDTAQALYGHLLDFDQLPFSTSPPKDSPVFSPIRLLLAGETFYRDRTPIPFSQFDMTGSYYETLSQSYETGRLRYGNGDPSAADLDSLADFCGGEGFVEIRLPWQLLNFADPTHMQIHDDYYAHYGVELLTIDALHVGAGDGSSQISMFPFPLERLGDDPEYHERLKQSYYILQDCWTS